MKTLLKNQPSGSGKQIFRSTTISLGFAAIMMIAALSFSSCRKKEKEVVEEEDTEQSTANDNNTAETFIADIESIGSQVSENGSLTTYKTNGTSGIEALEASACASITIAGQVITVDFGTVACFGADGRSRSGKLIYDYSNSSPSSATHYRNPGFSMNVTSQNYMVNGYAVNINSKTISNITPNTIPTGANPGTNLKWSINANISIVKPNNGGTITWTCNRTKELINTNDSTCYKGQSLPIDWRKAIVKLNGTASGVNAKNENYTALATDLVRDFNCAPDPVSRPHRHPFISGTIVYAPANRLQRTIDYGNGACDLQATITIKNSTFNVTLP